MIPAERIRRYLFEGLVPFSRDRTWDARHGGFHERLRPDGSPLSMGYTRLTVHCRQIYVLSHAALLGGSGDLVTRAGDAFEILRERFWDHERGGWFFSVEPGGDPADRTKDCYAHAFVLFCMAYLHRATGAREALEQAERTVEILEARFAEPHAGGFLEALRDAWEPVATPRRQNPHMHLLEGFLALYDATGDSRYAEHADRIFELFTHRFFDAERGTLGEFFTDDWTPHPETGQLVEPGHHFEWTWLLHRYATARARSEAHGAAARLYAFATHHGIHPEAGGVVDELDREGTTLRDTMRIWPTTEGIKAAVVRLEEGHPAEARDHMATLLDHLFERRLLEDGRWHEQIDPAGRPVIDYLPCSTPYHLFLGLSEALAYLEGAEAPEKP